MTVTHPAKKWDALDKRGDRDRIFGTERPQSGEETWGSRGLSAQNIFLDERVAAKMTREWSIDPCIDTTAPSMSELRQEIRELREMVRDLSESHAALEARLSALEEPFVKEPVIDNLWEISDNNLKQLEEVSGITRTPGKPTEQDPFDALKGLLIEYSDDTVDSVELVNSVRGK